MGREKEKDLKLVNIYIRIHNKQTLTMEDLAYLARYNPVCFKKTCDNLVYELPEAKALLKPFEMFPDPPSFPKTIPSSVADKYRKSTAQPEKKAFDKAAGETLHDEQVVQNVLDNLKEIEAGEVNTLQSINVGEVKELLGGLFMESLFPHSGLPEYFDMSKEQSSGTHFNARA